VRNYSRVLAQRLAGNSRFPEINGNFVQLLYDTSPLHDIGKVAIPDAILRKPGALTPDEFEIMKTHTTIGAETLNAALRQYPEARFLRMARDIAAAHHERYDGTGYPKGLAANDIPLAARFVSVADAYDALTSRRVYKDALSNEAASAIILRASHTQF